jgi:hypothetical protein
MVLQFIQTHSYGARWMDDTQAEQLARRKRRYFRKKAMGNSFHNGPGQGKAGNGDSESET